MQKIFFTWGKHILALVLFIGLSVAFFSPVFVDGKYLSTVDMHKATGMGQSQMAQYEESAEPGEFSVWSDAMFGGMPYVAKYGEPAPKLPGFKWLEKPFKGLDYLTASMVLIGLICFYILMCVMGVNWWLAIAGSIAFAFASYSVIIIVAGHIVKGYVMAYMPLTLAGMALLYKQRYLWGGILFLLGVAFSISNGHIQVTYYLMLFCLVVYAGYLVIQVKAKKWKELGLVTGIMAVCVVVVVLANAKKLYGDWELSQHSTRGGTELTTASTEGEKVSSGLDKEYAFQWSYGKKELLTLLIPNAYGGSGNSMLGPDSETYKVYRQLGAQVGKEVPAPLYWGDKPFTEGPVYFGALICFLFVIGMFVIKNPIKWWILGGSVFLTMIALGRNLAWFNDFLFYHLPVFNKFRTVEMALIIPGLTFPVIGMWGLNLILSGKSDAETFRKGWIWALGITGGLCLIVWLMPGLLLGFQSVYDQMRQLPGELYSALITDRASAASSDALRSLIFILLGAGLLFWFSKAKNKQTAATIVAIGITVLTLVDLWTIDRRYINDSRYIRQKPQELYQASAADKFIFEDPALSFRVATLNNPFMETDVSYFHHSIGGYHAAKLRRYQDLIDHRLSKEINSIISTLQTAQTLDDVYEKLPYTPTLNMLNTRYIIYNPTQPPLLNPYADGNAWFVENVRVVANPDEEIAALDVIDPTLEAVVDKRFADQLEGFQVQVDSAAVIELVSYRPNRLEYRSETTTEQLAVFSEIYYQPGWRAFIDGEPAPHLRADWTLRAMRIPAGSHTITFEHYPETYVKAAYIETFTSFFILLIIVGAIGYSLWQYFRKNPEVIVEN